MIQVNLTEIKEVRSYRLGESFKVIGYSKRYSEVLSELINSLCSLRILRHYSVPSQGVRVVKIRVCEHQMRVYMSNMLIILRAFVSLHGTMKYTVYLPQ